MTSEARRVWSSRTHGPQANAILPLVPPSPMPCGCGLLTPPTRFPLGPLTCPCEPTQSRSQPRPPTRPNLCRALLRHGNAGNSLRRNHMCCTAPPACLAAAAAAVHVHPESHGVGWEGRGEVGGEGEVGGRAHGQPGVEGGGDRAATRLEAWQARSSGG